MTGFGSREQSRLMESTASHQQPNGIMTQDYTARGARALLCIVQGPAWAGHVRHPSSSVNIVPIVSLLVISVHAFHLPRPHTELPQQEPRDEMRRLRRAEEWGSPGGLRARSGHPTLGVVGCGLCGVPTYGQRSRDGCS